MAAASPAPSMAGLGQRRRRLEGDDVDDVEAIASQQLSDRIADEAEPPNSQYTLPRSCAKVSSGKDPSARAVKGSLV